MSFGGTIKRIRSEIADISAIATGFVLGMMGFLPIEGVTLGATVQNIGSRLKFVTDSDRLPVMDKASAAYLSEHPDAVH